MKMRCDVNGRCAPGIRGQRTSGFGRSDPLDGRSLTPLSGPPISPITATAKREADIQESRSGRLQAESGSTPPDWSRPMQHGFPHSEVIAAAAFEISGFPLVISVDQCPTRKLPSTISTKSYIARSPAAQRRPRDVFTYVGDDTQREADRVTDIFKSFSR